MDENGSSKGWNRLSDVVPTPQGNREDEEEDIPVASMSTIFVIILIKHTVERGAYYKMIYISIYSLRFNNGCIQSRKLQRANGQRSPKLIDSPKSKVKHYLIYV